MGGEPNQVLWRGVQPVAGIRGVWPARNSLRVNERASQEGIGSVIVYTVPSGKILFVSSLFCASRLAVDGSEYAIFAIRDTSDVTQIVLVYHYYDLKDQLVSSSQFTPALEALAGWDVYLESFDANLDVIGGFFGWLEDA